MTSFRTQNIETSVWNHILVLFLSGTLVKNKLLGVYFNPLTSEMFSKQFFPIIFTHNFSKEVSRMKIVSTRRCYRLFILIF